jgi:hypothetical protein
MAVTIRITLPRIALSNPPLLPGAGVLLRKTSGENALRPEKDSFQSIAVNAPIEINIAKVNKTSMQ